MELFEQIKRQERQQRVFRSLDVVILKHTRNEIILSLILNKSTDVPLRKRSFFPLYPIPLFLISQIIFSTKHTYI